MNVKTREPVDAVLELGVHECKWPIGQPGERGFRFCRQRAVSGKVYCEEHCQRAYWNWERQ